MASNGTTTPAWVDAMLERVQREHDTDMRRAHLALLDQPVGDQREIVFRCSLFVWYWRAGVPCTAANVADEARGLAARMPPGVQPTAEDFDMRGVVLAHLKLQLEAAVLIGMDGLVANLTETIEDAKSSRWLWPRY